MTRALINFDWFPCRCGWYCLKWKRAGVECSKCHWSMPRAEAEAIDRSKRRG